MNESLIDYLLQLADDNLILGQRNSAWCGHGPILEQDIAITNISLDLIGQARSLYQYAATLINETHSPKFSHWVPATEDTLAYLRTEREFRNCLLTEQPNGDWAQTLLRQFLFSSYQFYLYRYLQTYPDKTLAAIAEKSGKEVSYHLRWSSEWVIRMGNGTDESQQRITRAAGELWRYTGELFIPADYETELGIDLATVKTEWTKKISSVFNEAETVIPEKVWMQEGGKRGIHTEHLGYILSELQYMQRTYPGCDW